MHLCTRRRCQWRTQGEEVAIQPMQPGGRPVQFQNHFVPINFRAWPRERPPSRRLWGGCSRASHVFAAAASFKMQIPERAHTGHWNERTFVSKRRKISGASEVVSRHVDSRQRNKLIFTVADVMGSIWFAPRISIAKYDRGILNGKKLAAYVIRAQFFAIDRTARKR